ncbi:TrmB family transcriptional regulator [Candidatus Micrarchaeota archaeon]|nr:TrmB family transcriptional regulator [Candidatus Micrarchaeota archaeon]
MSDAEIAEKLKLFGLSEYEAKAYSALATLGTASVTEVSQVCDVPRSNLYAALENLAVKGFAETQQGRPVLFKAIHPKEALPEIREKQVNELRKAEREITEKIGAMASKKIDATPALVWGVRGVNSVMNKLAEIISRSRKELFINITSVSVLSQQVLEELKRAKERDVEIRITTQKGGDLSKLRKLGIVRVREKIYGVDVLSDDKEVLVAPTYPIAAAWVDNPEMALHVKDFLMLVWKDAQILK